MYYASAITGATQWEVPASMTVVGPAQPATAWSDEWSDNPLHHAKI